jgi:hypothetical protein
MTKEEAILKAMEYLAKTRFDIYLFETIPIYMPKEKKHVDVKMLIDCRNGTYCTIGTKGKFIPYPNWR